ncbi:MAG: DUF935 family protein [Bacteroidota bacterium]
MVNELSIRSADRSPKDIDTWRNALRSAESVYFPNRCRLYDLYDDILLDGHLTGIISKRIDCVLNRTLYFEAHGRKIDAMDELIHSNEFRDIMRSIMLTPFWGISGIEFIPGSTFTFKKIPRKHIKPNLGIIAYEQNGNEGIPYTNMNNLWIWGDADDLGILLKCAPYALYKRGNMADWSQYIEIFGQPVRIIYYDAYDTQTKSELKKVLDESGSSLAMMIPKQAEFEMRDGKYSNGDGQLQDTFKNALNAEMSVVVLGNTETTTSSDSSGYAQSRVHAGQQLEITLSDMVYTANLLNSTRFLNVLRSYGYPVAEGRFCFSKDVDIAYLKQRMDIDMQLASRIAMADDYWYETYGIPKPQHISLK